MPKLPEISSHIRRFTGCSTVTKLGSESICEDSEESRKRRGGSIIVGVCDDGTGDGCDGDSGDCEENCGSWNSIRGGVGEKVFDCGS